MDLPVRGTPWITPQILVFAAIMISLPFWIERIGLYPYLGVEVAIWMIYALGFNILLGLTGLPSFGHGAFFGVGAYAFGLWQLNIVESLPLGLLAAISAGAIAGGLAGALVAHRRGIYFALMTIAISQVFWFVAIKWYGLTHGEDGLQGIPRPSFAGLDLGANLSLYWLCLGVLLAVTILLWRLVQSPLGKTLAAIRQNETRASFIGVNVRWLKWLAFTISTAVAGLAGGLFAMAQQSAYPDVMNLHASGLVIMMTLVGGGLVSFWGPVIGAAVFFVARDILGAYTEEWLLWYGLLFMVLVIFKPEGLAAMGKALLPRRREATALASADRPAERPS